MLARQAASERQRKLISVVPEVITIGRRERKREGNETAYNGGTCGANATVQPEWCSERA